MENRNKICPSCGTSNDPSYSFCHVCGTALNGYAAPTAPPAAPTVQNVGGENSYGANDANPAGNAYGAGNTYGAGSTYGAGNYNAAEPQTVAGCPTEAVRTFVGSGKLYDKMVKTELTGSTVSWVWPVFILALLFGSVGIIFTSLWFFYRKMTKWALLISLVGVAFLSVYCFVYLRELKPMVQLYFDFFKEALVARTTEDFTSLANEFEWEVESIIMNGGILIGAAVAQIINLVGLGIGIVLSLFGVKIYKNHVAKKLPGLLESNTPAFVIAQRGGTSAAAVVLMTLAIITVETALTVAAFLI